VEKFLNGEVQHAFQLKLYNRFAALNDEDEPVDEFWENTKSIVLDEARNCVGKTKRSKNERMSKDTMDLIQRRKLLVRPDQRKEANELKAKIKESMELDDEVYWSSQADEMNRATRNGDTGKLFKIIKRISGKSMTISEVVKENNGDVITQQMRRVERWAEHFSTLLNRPPPAVPRDDHGFEGFLEISEDTPSSEEVKRAINQLRTSSAPGEDGIPPVLWKHGGQSLAKRLTRLIQRVWDTSQLPSDWYSSIIIPLFKKGDKTVCSNHRGISLLDTAYKLLEIIILNRIRPESETIARENQCGFRPGRSTIDQILALRLIIEQRQEYREPIVIGFVDFKAAFDSVDRSRMFDILGEAGIPRKIVEMVRLLYSRSNSSVRVYKTESESFPVETGVKQGAILSPVLFNFVVDAILRKSMTHNLGVRLSESETITDLDYADDIAMLAESNMCMQTLMDQLNEAAAEVGLQISATKTKLTHRNCPVPNINLGGERLEVVDDFPYLGSRIDLSGNCSRDISTRIAKASNAFNTLSRRLWNSRSVSLQTKLKVYDAAIRPILTYSCDTWAIKAADMARLQAFEFRCWRRILNVTYLDRISNDEVRRRIKPKWLLRQYVVKKRLSLLGHVLRMDPGRIPKKCLFAKCPRAWKRPPGGVRLTWLRQVFRDFEPLRLHYAYPAYSNRRGSIAWLEVLEGIALDRHQWRLLVDCAVEAGVT
jgi:hypothetical protein